MNAKPINTAVSAFIGSNGITMRNIHDVAVIASAILTIANPTPVVALAILSGFPVPTPANLPAMESITPPPFNVFVIATKVGAKSANNPPIARAVKI